METGSTTYERITLVDVAVISTSGVPTPRQRDSWARALVTWDFAAHGSRRLPRGFRDPMDDVAPKDWWPSCRVSVCSLKAAAGDFTKRRDQD